MCPSQLWRGLAEGSQEHQGVWPCLLSGLELSTMKPGCRECPSDLVGRRSSWLRAHPPQQDWVPGSPGSGLERIVRAQQMQQGAPDMAHSKASFYFISLFNEEGAL